jgi:DNA-directed RNA polymerase subunit N (RpoN/RPB10)
LICEHQVIKYKKHNKQRIAKMDSQVLERKKQELELDDLGASRFCKWLKV